MVSALETFKYPNSLEMWVDRQGPVTEKPHSLTLLSGDLRMLLRLHTSAEGFVHIQLFAESRALNVTFLGPKVKAL